MASSFRSSHLKLCATLSPTKEYDFLKLKEYSFLTDCKLDAN